MDLLFNEHNITDAIRHFEAKLRKEIEAIDATRLLNTSVDQWCDYFEKEYRLNVPRLDEGGIEVEQEDANIDVRHDPLRLIRDRSRPVYVKGTTLSFIIPFEGDHNLFKCQPTTYSLNPPAAKVAEQQMVLRYARTDHETDAVKKEFNTDLASIKSYLSQLEKDVAPYNSSLGGNARALIEARRAKLLTDQKAAASFGFPVRRREGAPTTYAAPTVRLKSPAQKPSPSAHQPEPVLEMREYDHILSVVSNMVAVIERSPHAFKTMGEEDLRQHFLVQLNGQHEGQATGETFNFEGKTDILIRVEGQNIFIAECKFWRGPDSFKQAVDQLLGYLSWRDTKAALLIFNRNKGFSSVVAQIPDLVKGHANFLRELPYPLETGFRFVMHHRDDSQRELVLTVLAFDVPV